MRLMSGSIALVLFAGAIFMSNAHAATARPMYVIGHRGLGAEHPSIPENSIRSLAGALKAGAHAVEFDVQLSSDGELVVVHDPKLDRVSDGMGCVANTPLEEIRKHRVRDGSGRFHADRIATLDEVLDALKPFSAGRESQRYFLDIHIKVFDGLRGDWAGWTNDCPNTDFKTLTEKVVRSVTRHGLMSHVIFTSFDERVLDFIRARVPRARVGLLSVLSAPLVIENALGRYDAVGLLFATYSDEDLRLAERNGLEVLVWTVSETEALREAIAPHHVSAVVTDQIPNALQACGKRCYSGPRKEDLNEYAKRTR